MDVNLVGGLQGRHECLNKTEVRRSIAGPHLYVTSQLRHKDNDFFPPTKCLKCYNFREACSYNFDIQIILPLFSLHLLVDHGPTLAFGVLACRQDVGYRQPCRFCKSQRLTG